MEPTTIALWTVLLRFVFINGNKTNKQTIQTFYCLALSWWRMRVDIDRKRKWSLWFALLITCAMEQCNQIRISSSYRRLHVECLGHTKSIHRLFFIHIRCYDIGLCVIHVDWNLGFPTIDIKKRCNAGEIMRCLVTLASCPLKGFFFFFPLLVKWPGILCKCLATAVVLTHYTLAERGR